MRIERNRCKENDERFANRIGGVDRNIESRVVDGTLSALHPVDDAAAFGIDRPISAHGDARILRELREGVQLLSIGQ